MPLVVLALSNAASEPEFPISEEAAVAAIWKAVEEARAEDELDVAQGKVCVGEQTEWLIGMLRETHVASLDAATAAFDLKEAASKAKGNKILELFGPNAAIYLMGGLSNRLQQSGPVSLEQHTTTHPSKTRSAGTTSHNKIPKKPLGAGEEQLAILVNLHNLVDKVVQVHHDLGEEEQAGLDEMATVSGYDQASTTALAKGEKLLSGLPCIARSAGATAELHHTTHLCIREQLHYTSGSLHTIATTIAESYGHAKEAPTVWKTRLRASIQKVKAQIHADVLNVQHNIAFMEHTLQVPRQAA